MRLRLFYVFTMVMITSLVTGCANDRNVIRNSQSPLFEYLEQNGFTAFNPPRSGDGVGTIVQFDQLKQETIVFPAEKCFPLAFVPRENNAVALLETEYTLASDNNVEFSLPQLTKYKVDLSGAIGNNGVKSVSIKFDAPTVQRITKGEAKDYIRSLPTQNSCVEEILRGSNFVVHSVLGARGFEYTFNGEDGSKLALTAEILQSIKASSSTSQQFKGASSLKFKAENADNGGIMLLGYRSWKAAEVPGALKSGIEFVDLSKSDMQILKK